MNVFLKICKYFPFTSKNNRPKKVDIPFFKNLILGPQNWQNCSSFLLRIPCMHTAGWLVFFSTNRWFTKIFWLTTQKGLLAGTLILNVSQNHSGLEIQCVFIHKAEEQRCKHVPTRKSELYGLHKYKNVIIFVDLF